MGVLVLGKEFVFLMSDIILLSCFNSIGYVGCLFVC